MVAGRRFNVRKWHWFRLRHANRGEGAVDGGCIVCSAWLGEVPCGQSRKPTKFWKRKRLFGVGKKGEHNTDRERIE